MDETDYRLQLEKREKAICELAHRLALTQQCFQEQIDKLNDKMSRESADNWKYHASITEELDKLRRL